MTLTDAELAKSLVLWAEYIEAAKVSYQRPQDLMREAARRLGRPAEASHEKAVKWLRDTQTEFGWKDRSRSTEANWLREAIFQLIWRKYAGSNLVALELADAILALCSPAASRREREKGDGMA